MKKTFYLVLFLIVSSSDFSFAQVQTSSLQEITNKFISSEKEEENPIKIFYSSRGKDQLHADEWDANTVFLTGNNGLQNEQTLIENATESLATGTKFYVIAQSDSRQNVSEKQEEILSTFGKWVDLNREAILGSTKWEANGNAPTGIRTKKSEPYKEDEVRFTTDGEFIYVFILRPKRGTIRLPELRLQTNGPENIQYINIVGCGTAVRFKQKEKFLRLKIPKKRVTGDYTLVLRVKKKRN